MLHLIAKSKSESGFTLIETLVVVVLIGVLAAVATPSFTAWRNKNNVNQAITNTRSALIEAYRQAQRQSQNCSINLGASSISSSDNCLLSARDLPSNVELASNLTGGKLDFDFNGNISAGGTIVLYEQETGYKKCLVISEPLAIIREGSYTGDISSINDSNCKKD
ncbi:MAG: type II secretion system protein [Prochloraceae cyanobacterium]|nr:type II secretion system protein [Prochloraceae cyanobacterium]